jgi:two-component system sensor histidine kinase/response regulator
MGQLRIQRHLDALDLARDIPPDRDAWAAFLDRLADERLALEVHRRERYLEAVVEMQTRLLSTVEDHLGAYNHALTPLGEASGAARVYLFENQRRPEDGALVTFQRAEWCAPGIKPEIDNPMLQGVSYDEFLPAWSEALGRGDRVERLADEYDELEAMLLGPQGVLSLLILPLMVDGEFTGFIGFDNCTSQTRWTTLEVNLLSAAATQIGLVLAQRRAQRQLRRANDEVAAARDRAVEASRAKSVFLAKMSHELRTPLNAILGYAELLRESDGDTPRADRDADLDRVLGAGRHLLAIIDDLLDVARIETDHLRVRREPVDVRGLLDTLVDEAQHLARRNRNELVTAFPADPGPLVSDRTRVHQVLLNLLTNACKYTIGGRVTFAVLVAPDHLRFEVRDTGIGIATDHLERIFEAFTQVDDSTTRRFEGTGLGLTISRNLANLLGGALTVESTLGEGSTFALTLPRLPL